MNDYCSPICQLVMSHQISVQNLNYNLREFYNILSEDALINYPLLTRNEVQICESIEKF